MIILHNKIRNLEKSKAKILTEVKKAKEVIGECNLNVYGTSQALDILDNILLMESNHGKRNS
jgi:hypothetical protein